MTRGVVLPLSLTQIATRARYLGQLCNADQLDPFVRNPKPMMVDGFYLLEEHNGNRDPTAPDPFKRWSKPDSMFVNRTADCVEGAAWCGGWDRKQPVRFAHLYDGDINTNSMLLDAFGERRCFEPLDRPMPGCYAVAPTGAPGFEECGHVMTVYAVPLEWDWDTFDCWKLVLGVDIAKRDPHPANRPTTAAAWFRARGHDASHASFVRSTMTA